MKPRITNLVVHGKEGKERPCPFGLNKFLKIFCLPIKKHHVTWEYGNKIVSINLGKVVSWIILPDKSGIVIIYYHKKYSSNNAKIINADGSERLTIKNNFDKCKFSQHSDKYYFAKVWIDSKEVLIAVEMVVKNKDACRRYYLYKSKLNIDEGTTASFEPLEEK